MSFDMISAEEARNLMNPPMDYHINKIDNLVRIMAASNQNYCSYECNYDISDDRYIKLKLYLTNTKKYSISDTQISAKKIKMTLYW